MIWLLAGSVLVASCSSARDHAATTSSTRAPNAAAHGNVVTTPTASTLAHSCRRPTRAGETLGGVAIYDSKSAVRARLGAPLGFERDGDVAVWRYRDLRVEFAEHQGVVRVEAISPLAKTNVGIGVGSSGESLVAAYPGHLRSSYVTFHGPGAATPAGINAYGFDTTYPHSGMSFRLTEGRVQQIRLDGGCPVQRLSDDPPSGV